MDNSVATLDDTPPSEMLLDDQPSGTSVISKDGQGRQMRAPPSHSKEINSAPGNADEVILPSEASQNHASPENISKLSVYAEESVFSVRHLFPDLIQL